MEKVFYKNLDFQPATINEVERSVIFFASTPEFNRNDMIVEPTSFQLDKIQALPVLLNHNPNQAIGKILWAKIQNAGLLVKAYISNKTNLAKDVWALIQEGIISFASAGFMPVKFEEIENGLKFTEVDLFEISLTPTPADKNAIMLSLEKCKTTEIKNILENLKNEQEEEQDMKEILEKIELIENQLKEKTELIEKLENKINQFEEKERQKEEKNKIENFYTNFNKKLEEISNKI